VLAVRSSHGALKGHPGGRNASTQLMHHHGTTSTSKFNSVECGSVDGGKVVVHWSTISDQSAVREMMYRG